MTRKLFTKSTVWGIAILLGILIGVGMSQTPQSDTGTAAQGEKLAQLRQDFNALKAKKDKLNAEWQSALLVQLVPTLADASSAVKRQFVDFLEELGTPSTAALTEMLHEPSARVREKAVEALGKIGERERKAGRNTDAIAISLAAALSDATDRVRREALEELDDVRPTSQAALAVVVPALTAVRTKGSSSARSDVIDMLGRIGEKLAENGQPTETIRDALIASLTDNSTKVRTNAIDELSDIQNASAETFAALINALSDSSSTVRRNAEDALIKLGKPVDTIVAPMLATAFESGPARATRGHIVDVLGALGEARAETGNSVGPFVPTLLLALEDASAEVRRNAADELGQMRATQPEVLTALRSALNDSSKSVRSAAQKAIQRIEKAK